AVSGPGPRRWGRGVAGRAMRRACAACTLLCDDPGQEACEACGTPLPHALGGSDASGAEHLPSIVLLIPIPTVPWHLSPTIPSPRSGIVET
ncbi:unnamed protein product, partial [Prorocentrum cordatum]